MRRTHSTLSVAMAAVVAAAVTLVGAGAFGQQGPDTVVQVNDDADDLAEALLGDTSPTAPITVTDASYTGHFEAIGTFEDGPFGLEEGIAISSGRIDEMPFQSTWDESSTGFGEPGHWLCDQLTAPYDSNDAAVLSLTFDVSSSVDGIEIEFVVASDEYPQWVGSEFNDGFGVFLNGQNIALDNNGNSININGPFFSGGTVLEHPDSESNFLGSTPRLTSAADITPGSTNNTLDVVVCDAADDIVDTAAFLTALDGCIGDCEGTAVCGDGIVQASEQCDLDAFDPAYAECPDGYEGSPMCNNDPDNPEGDGSCTVDDIPYGCTPIDYCADPGLNSCSENAICIDTYPPPGYDCECMDGYVGDGFICTIPVDIEDPADGSSTNDTTPPITGTGEPGEEVTIYIDGEEVGTTEVDDDGNWEFEPDEELDDGEVVIVAEDPYSADEVTIDIDTEAPAITIGYPDDGATLNESPASIDGEVDDDDAEVVVYIDGVPVGTAEVDDDGEWSIDIDEDLDDGTYVATATATDEAGNQSEDEIEFTIDTTEDLEILQPSEGDIVRTDTPTVSGEGEPGDEIDIYVDGEYVGTVDVDDDGNWEWTPDEPMDDGDVTVTATTDTPSGPQDDEVTFEIDTDTEDVIIEEPGDGDLVSESRPEIRGSAAPGAEVTVFIDGEVECVTTADVNGHWSCTPDEKLDDGEVYVEAEADDEGLVTEDDVLFEIDTEPPPLAIERPEDEEVVSPTGVVVEGTAEPGAEVEVYLDGEYVGTATADDNGDWQMELDELDDGEEYEVVATTTDEAGNEAEDDVLFFVEDLEDIDEFEGYMTGGGPNCAVTGGDTGMLVVLLALVVLVGLRRRRD